MTTLVKIHRKGQMTLPSQFRSALGVGEGDVVEASLRGGKIVLTPRLVVARPTLSKADDEYTPAQRRVIDARLAKADEDIKHGRLHGPFETHEEMVNFLHSQLGKKPKKLPKVR